MKKTLFKLSSLGLLSIILSTILYSSVSFAQGPIELNLNPQENPGQPKPTLSYEVKATKTLEDVLTVRNNSKTETYHFKVYPVDAIQSTEGASAFKLASAPENHIGSWVTFSQPDQSIQPGQTLYLPYQINIPAKITPGTYKGGLIAELVDSKDKTSQINVVTRIVEPIIISIPGRKLIDYNLDNFNYEQINGTPSFYLKFSNKGNVLLRAEVNLTIAGTLLSEPYQMTLNHPTILQNSSFEKAFLFENPPMFGDYQADLNFRVYQYDVNKDQFVLLTIIHKSLHFGIVPYSCLLALLILIILIVLAERWRRRHLKEQSKNTFIHKVKKGETLTSIGALYKVNWRIIAKTNHIHRPYALTPGDELVLPFPKVKTPRKGSSKQ